VRRVQINLHTHLRRQLTIAIAPSLRGDCWWFLSIWHENVRDGPSRSKQMQTFSFSCDGVPRWNYSTECWTSSNAPSADEI